MHQAAKQRSEVDPSAAQSVGQASSDQDLERTLPSCLLTGLKLICFLNKHMLRLPCMSGSLGWPALRQRRVFALHESRTHCIILEGDPCLAHADSNPPLPSPTPCRASEQQGPRLESRAVPGENLQCGPTVPPPWAHVSRHADALRRPAPSHSLPPAPHSRVFGPVRPTSARSCPVLQRISPSRHRAEELSA